MKSLSTSRDASRELSEDYAELLAIYQQGYRGLMDMLRNDGISLFRFKEESERLQALAIELKSAKLELFEQRGGTRDPKDA